MKLHPCAQHKYAGHTLNPEEEASNACLYNLSSDSNGRSQSHTPAGLQKQTQNMALVL